MLVLALIFIAILDRTIGKINDIQHHSEQYRNRIGFQILAGVKHTVGKITQDIERSIHQIPTVPSHESPEVDTKSHGEKKQNHQESRDSSLYIARHDGLNVFCALDGEKQPQVRIGKEHDQIKPQ